MTMASCSKIYTYLIQHEYRYELDAIYVQEYLKLREQKRRKGQIISPEL